MVLDPIPQSLPVHFFGSRPQPPTSLPTPPSRHPVFSLSLAPSISLLRPFSVSLSVLLYFPPSLPHTLPPSLPPSVSPTVTLSLLPSLPSSRTHAPIVSNRKFIAARRPVIAQRFEKEMLIWRVFIKTAQPQK